MSAKYVHSMKCEAGSDSGWRDELGEDLQIPRRMVIIKIASDNFYPGSEITRLIMAVFNIWRSKVGQEMIFCQIWLVHNTAHLPPPPEKSRPPQFIFLDFYSKSQTVELIAHLYERSSSILLDTLYCAHLISCVFASTGSSLTLLQLFLQNWSRWRGGIRKRWAQWHRHAPHGSQYSGIQNSGFELYQILE